MFGPGTESQLQLSPLGGSQESKCLDLTSSLLHLLLGFPLAKQMEVRGHRIH